MALEAEDFWVESMGFGPLWSSQDFFMASVLGIGDAFDFTPFADSYNHHNNNLASFGSPPSLNSQLENQSLEMDLFLQLEGKRMRRLVLEEQKRQQAALTHACETRIQNLVFQKDQELSAARNRNRELEHRLRAAESQAAAWEKKAGEKEGVVSDLRRRLSQAKNDDTASFCDSSGSSASTGGGCKVCRRGGRLCVVFFPCKHLCCCRGCEPLLGHCPVCQTVKEGCVEVCLG